MLSERSPLYLPIVSTCGFGASVAAWVMRPGAVVAPCPGSHHYCWASVVMNGSRPVTVWLHGVGVNRLWRLKFVVEIGLHGELEIIAGHALAGALIHECEADLFQDTSAVAVSDLDVGA